MVASRAAGSAVFRNSTEEQVQHRACTVVVVNTDCDDKAGLAVDEAVNDQLVSNEAW